MDKRRAAFLVATGLCIAAMAFGSVWPFLNAWEYRGNPAWTAARAWATGNAQLEPLVGGKVHLASDMFPTGGENGSSARYEFKVQGDEGKKKVRILMANEGAGWKVTRAEVEDGGGWKALE